MSKRPLEKPTESREERWLRKMKWYEEKIDAKRRKKDARENRHQEPQGQQSLPTVSRDVQNEGHSDYNVDVSARPSDSEVELPNTNEVPPNYEEIPLPQDEIETTRQDIAYDEVSVMTETTACTSPTNSFYDETDKDVAAVDDFDPELLRELGDVETDPAEFGDNLQPDVAARFQKILQEGIKKEIKEDLLKKYPFPKNVPLAKSPTLNPEIGAMLPETCKLRDKRLLTKQDQLGKTLSALGKALTGLLKKNPNIPESIRNLNDAGILLADSHYAETDTRRSVIIPLIDKLKMKMKMK
ncbi:hypothetical protein O0L34_g19012 [Tuta absoluta]|nr:hypothetical protein O0L34_g19012 [Tuta absoluta]